MSSKMTRVLVVKEIGMKVVVAGGTGFVGVKLIERLHSLGNYEITLLARDPQRANRQFPNLYFPKVTVVGYSPLQAGDWTKVLIGANAVINLAGTPIFGEAWTEKRKQEIIQSRQISTRVLVKEIGLLSNKPKVLINGSAIGFYGTDLTKIFDEYSFAGNDFLAGVCKAWEAETEPLIQARMRVIKLRTGIVLGRGGVLDRILPIFKLGLGGKLGSGKQWFSWVHIEDLVSLILFAITNNQLENAVNGTAPEPVTNREFTKALAKILDRPAFIPAPAASLQLLYGESATLILDGQRVLPVKSQRNGFKFQYPEINGALSNILGS
jgi:uncharacterized protein